MSEPLFKKLLARGLLRTGTAKRGFCYRWADGRRPTHAELSRVRQLRSPPAWTEVAIDPSPSARVLAVGRDRAGRVQYRYGERAVREREDRKLRRVLAFGQALPQLRAQVAKDLHRPQLDRRRVLACMVRILDTCFFRPGSASYAKENGSVGLATLQAKHVKVLGPKVSFEFFGKAKQRQSRELVDGQVARTVRDLLRVPGKEVFKWVTDDERVVDVRRRHINEYLAEVTGHRYTAKDFRTWAGNVVCAGALARVGGGDLSRRECRRRIVVAVKETAEHLGNTPAVCRSSYITGALFHSFESGKAIAHPARALEIARHHGPGLHPAEREFLRLLREANVFSDPPPLNRPEAARRRGGAPEVRRAAPVRPTARTRRRGSTSRPTSRRQPPAQSARRTPR